MPINLKSYYKEHELLRRQVWMLAWSATANATDCKEHGTATLYADAALEEFDKRFGPIQDEVADAD